MADDAGTPDAPTAPESTPFDTLAVRRRGDVLDVTLTRPRRANAVNRRMMRDLISLADGLVGRDDIAFVVLRGGDRIFSAGADLHELTEELQDAAPRTLVRSMQRLGQEAVAKLESIEQTVIAALHGSAYGAGLGVALTADYRVMADDAVANLPETRIGLFLTYGLTHRLVALLGPARTQEFIDFAEDLDAARCHQWGLVTRTAPGGRVDDEVDDIIDRLRGRDRAARRVTKKLVRAAAAPIGDLIAGEDEIVDGLISLGTAQREIGAFTGGTETKE